MGGQDICSLGLGDTRGQGLWEDKIYVVKGILEDRDYGRTTYVV